jgi:hypothetical protein
MLSQGLEGHQPVAFDKLFFIGPGKMRLGPGVGIIISSIVGPAGRQDVTPR